MRYVPNYNIRDRQYTSLHTSGELPSLPSLLPTSKSAHDKHNIYICISTREETRRQTARATRLTKIKQPYRFSVASARALTYTQTINRVAIRSIQSQRRRNRSNSTSYIVKEHTSKGKYSEHLNSRYRLRANFVTVSLFRR